MLHFNDLFICHVPQLCCGLLDWTLFVLHSQELDYSPSSIVGIQELSSLFGCQEGRSLCLLEQGMRLIQSGCQMALVVFLTEFRILKIIYPLFAFCLFGFFVLSRRPLSGHFKKSVTAGQWGNWVFLISSVSTCLCYLFDSQSKTSPARKIPPQTLRRAQSQKSVQVALLFCLVKSLVLVVWFFLSRFICFWTD